MLQSEITATALPPTREEIAQAFEPAFWVEWLIALDSGPCFCLCEFAVDRAACLRRLQLQPARCRPRARARRRRRHSGSRGERSLPGDDGDGGSDPAPPQPRGVGGVS